MSGLPFSGFHGFFSPADERSVGAYCQLKLEIPELGTDQVAVAVKVRDMPVVQACGLIFAAFYILLNMAADMIAIIANPRLRHPR